MTNYYVNHQKSILMVFLLFVSSFLGWSDVTAQTLVTDENVPELSACGDEGTFTVKIRKGAIACSSGFLEIAFPTGDGFEYVAGSNSIGATETNVTPLGATLQLPNIPVAAMPDDFLIITFKGKANCEAISSVNKSPKPFIKYTLSGCGVTSSANSEDLNIKFAVLSISLSNSDNQGVIGSEIDRTITIRNNGNGEIGHIFLTRNLGSSLSLVSTVTPAGWTLNDSNSTLYEFTGNKLLPGETLIFTEKVKINNCASLSSSYEAYFGCSTKCTLGNANSGIVPINLSINTSLSPSLSVVVKTNPSIFCFNQEYEYEYEITNNGTAKSILNSIKLYTNPNAGSSYINTSSIYVNGVLTAPTSSLYLTTTGTPYGTTGKPYEVMVPLPDINLGEKVTVRFKQFYALPLESCPSLSFFRRGTSEYQMVYANSATCPPAGGSIPRVFMASVNFKPLVDYSFNGENGGDIDIVGDYNAEFKINAFSIGNNTLVANDSKFDIEIDLSGGLDASVLSSSNIKIETPSGFLNPTNVLIVSPTKAILSFIYGTAAWPVNTIISIPVGSLITFPLKLNCSSVENPSYTIKGVLHKSISGVCTPITIGCNTVSLTKHCGGPCPEGGLHASVPKLTRLTFGQYDKSPDDSRPDDPASANIDPFTDDLTGIRTRNFTMNDIIRVTQPGRATITGSSPVTAWKKGFMKMIIPTNHATIIAPVANSGVVTIKDNSTNISYTINNVPVIINATDYAIDISINSLLTIPGNGLPVNFAYENNDEITSSLDFKYTSGNDVNGLKTYPMKYYFLADDIADTKEYACGGGFTASGFYGKLVLDQPQLDNSANIVSCNNNALNRYLFRFSVNSYSKNLLFPNEYRRFATLDKVSFKVPTGLELVGVRVQIWNNGNIGSSTAQEQDFFLPTPISGGTYDFDMQTAIAAIKTGNYLDDGYDLYASPIVRVLCTQNATETVVGSGYYSGTFHYSGTDYINATDVKIADRNFVFNINSSGLNPQIVTNHSEADGGTVSWIVQVTNSSTVRNFSNVWLGKKSSSVGLNVTSVQRVTNSSGTTTVGSILPEVNGVFQLGDFAVNTSSYYKVTAALTDCEAGELILSAGFNCGAYPATVNEGCGKELTKVTYSQKIASLQTSIINQNLASARPKLCDPLKYEIEINNSGTGGAKDLILTIPVNLAGQLTYVPNTLNITSPFTTGSGVYGVLIDDANVDVSDPLFIKIMVPAARVPQLNGGQKLRIKFDLKTNGCDFESGQKISFVPSGKNLCGSNIAVISPASSNRVTIEGAPSNEPVLSITQSDVTNLVSFNNTNVLATYNFTLRNVGEPGNTFSASADYNFAIKLPTNWEFEGNPQDYVDITKATYVGVDATYGYVFKLASTLTIGNEVKVVNAKIKYVGDVTSLACGFDLGKVSSNAYIKFDAGSSCGTTCTLTQINTTNIGNSILLPKPIAPTVAANQAFCSSVGAKISDIAITTHLPNYAWYVSNVSTTVLDANTALIDGNTYYLANKFAENSTCESDRVAVVIKIDIAQAANAGPDQNGPSTNFTLAGNQPTTPGTGLWTEVVAAGETAIATIANPTIYNSSVTVPLGKTANLKWTITNGTCSSDDVVSIVSNNTIDLKVEKTADKSSVIAGEEITYSVVITNKGEASIASGQAFSLNEEVPSILTGVTYSSNEGNYNAISKMFTPSILIGKNDKVTLTVKGTVPANSMVASITNKVTVAPPTNYVDNTPEDNEDEVVIPVDRSVDLSVLKEANKTTVIAGDGLNYKITISNLGVSTLNINEVINIIDILPIGFTKESISSTGGTYNENTGDFTLSSALAKNGTVVININGKVNADYTSTEIKNKVSVSTPPGVIDPVPGNNESDVTTIVTRNADVSILKEADKTSVIAGTALTYKVTITNLGISTLGAGEKLTVTDNLPSGFSTSGTITSSNGAYNISTGELILSSSLVTNGTVIITIPGTISPSYTGSNIINTVNVDLPNGIIDPTPSNNSSTVTTPVTKSSDLLVSKVASSMAPIMGTNLVFTIKANNNGPSQATNVTVTDILNSGYSFISSNTTTGSYNNNTGIWSIGTLDVYQEVSLTITVSVNTTGNYSNNASVTGTETDPDITNNESTVTPIPVSSPPVAVNDSETTKANHPVTITTITNDYPGRSNSPLVPNSIEIISNPQYGKLIVNPDGTVTYIPNNGFVGEDVFTYRIKDELGLWSNVATVTITIVANDLRVPNVFTPNGDNTNDYFEIIGIEGYDRTELIIFNRWGNEVYKNSNYSNNWNGKDLNDGTYYYLIKLMKGSNETSLKGWVLLKR